MKRTNILVLVLLALALVLAACGPGVEGPLPGSNSQPPTEGVTSPDQSEAGATTPTASGTKVVATLGIVGNPTFPAPAIGGQLNTPTPSPFDQLPAYVNTARKWLAGEVVVPAGQVKYVADEPAEWPDSCLGLGQADESCLQAVTPGHKITFEVGGTQYVVRTDEDAEVVRLEQ